MYMDFLQKIKPSIQTDDPIVLEFTLRTLEDVYWMVPSEWSEILIKNVQQTNKNEELILSSLIKFRLSDRAVELLIEGIEQSSPSIKPFYLMVMENVDPDLALRHQDKLATYIESAKWEFYELLNKGKEEEIREEYRRVLIRLNQEPYFNQTLYYQAKLIVKALIDNHWISGKEIEQSIQAQLEDDYFSYEGILAVYMIGLLGLESFAPLLVTLLDRDEDILLEETADALISFQSDKVVEMVSPYARLEASSIFAMAVLSGTKTRLSAKVLQELMVELENEDDQSLAFEGLCQQLVEEALPAVNNYLKSNPSSYLIDIEETAYSFYKIMGFGHLKSMRS
jgi:hypothetical protein